MGFPQFQQVDQWIPAMQDLPEPPQRLTHADTTILFSHLTPENLQTGFVPGYHFTIFDARGRDVGRINLRIGRTLHLVNAAGHIGYEIHPRHRGNRYAEKACRALAPWAASFKMDLIITANPDNQASLRTIENLGAEFIDEVDVPPGDPHFERRDKRKKRYLWKLAEMKEEG